MLSGFFAMVGQFHPCALRTAIIVLSTAVHVSGLHHRGVREHAAIPADVLEGARRLSAVVAHPEAGVAGDIQLAVRIVRQAMTAGLVVRSRAFDGRVVLRHVEIDGPRPQRSCHRLQRIIERFRAGPVEPFRQQSILGCVVAQREQQRVRHVGLEAERLRPIHLFEQLEIPLPAVHAAPADLAFGGEPFAEPFRDRARLAEGLRDLLRVAVRILGPLRRTRGRIDPDDARRSNPDVTQLLADLARFPDLRDELLALALVPHRRAAAGGRPHRRHQRADRKVPRADAIGEPLDLVVARVDADVRIEQKQVDAVELHAVDRCVGGEIEHRVEVDRRLRVGPFADQPRPHRVVEAGNVCDGAS